MARITMGLMAIANLGYMLWVLMDPVTGAQFMGVIAESATGHVELRAMYAGLIGGLGFVNLLGAIKPHRLQSALWATAWILCTVGMVRGGSCLALGIGRQHLAFTLLELGAAALCFWLLSRCSVFDAAERADESAA